eukprot:3302012-Pyramimonas_sp.AAC.1
MYAPTVNVFHPGLSARGNECVPRQSMCFVPDFRHEALRAGRADNQGKCCSNDTPTISTIMCTPTTMDVHRPSTINESVSYSDDAYSNNQ